MQTELWAVSGIAATVAGIAAFADRRRLTREDLDRVGIMPWPGVLVAAMLTAIVAAALAVKG
ncbi:hypothetical protein [Sphingomonas sanxanigenens]|uniref:Uncharacterized protein n=1 Tax=Sphingomonas sanxanigenens DSM 19645 = NX02 TaxID=1123269 RepID=W0ADK9_9SPHN|nr:hypothetical protein [Sphingomonas sanxanigenens]AHE54617.1 hypothetical protein NX02_14665 [Sphingomonas sanxanigenens DSM 19645 = NX02]